MALKILTVDDSKTIRLIVKKAFKPYDCDLFEGENGVEGFLVKLDPKKEEKSEKSPSQTCFSMDGDILCLVVPAKVNFEIIGNALGNIKSEMAKTAEPAKNRLIFDLSNFSEINMSLIKLIMLADEKCRQSEIHLQVVGNSKLNKELKGLAETAELPVYHTVKAAKAAKAAF